MPDNTVPLIQEITTANGTKVHISPQPEKPLLFLLRMASGDMGIWDANWEYLCRYFSVAHFSLKMPSIPEMSDARLMFKRLAQDCLDVAQSLDANQFHILGWTGGAHVALCCAADFPEHVGSMTLVAPFFRLADSRPLSVATEFMRVLMQHGGRGLYSYYWFMAGFSPEFVRSQFNEIENWVDARLKRDQFMQSDPEKAIRWIQVLRTFSLADAELEKIAAPALIIGPGLDTAYIGPNSEMARALHDRIPCSELAITPDYGSLMMLEAPQVFQSISRSFFERVSKRNNVPK